VRYVPSRDKYGGTRHDLPGDIAREKAAATARATADKFIDLARSRIRAARSGCEACQEGTEISDLAAAIIRYYGVLHRDLRRANARPINRHCAGSVRNY